MMTGRLQSSQRILVLGAGRGGTAMLDLFLKDPQICIAGIVDPDPQAPALAIARQHGIENFTDLAEAIEASRPCVAFNLTGDHGVTAYAEAQLGNANVIGGVQALFLWNVLRRLKQSEEGLRIAATAFESQDGMVVTDTNGVILRVNRAFTEITGYAEEEAVGQTQEMLKSGRHDAAFYAVMWESIKHTGAWNGEIWSQRKSGEIYPGRLSITAVKGNTREVTHYVATLHDITERKAAEAEIKTLGFYDSLTGLPNRRLLLDRLKQALASSTRSGRKAALLFIDLDDFKTINDSLGHATGDMLLQQVAQRLTSCVRDADTVARLGGDEFVVMLEDLSIQAVEAAEQTEAIGEKILATLNQPYHLGTLEYRGTPSVGATLFTDHQDGLEELLKQADLAMYQAKKAGRNTLRFFDPQMQTSVNARVTARARLHHGRDYGHVARLVEAARPAQAVLPPHAPQSPAPAMAHR